MICPYCKKTIPDGSSFCGYCGSNVQTQEPISKAAEEESMHCPFCGCKVSESYEHCPSCGAVLIGITTKKKDSFLEDTTTQVEEPALVETPEKPAQIDDPSNVVEDDPAVYSSEETEDDNSASLEPEVNEEETNKGLAVMEAIPQMRCPSCGCVISNDDTRCPSCGILLGEIINDSNINATVIEQETAVEETPAIASEEETEAMPETIADDMPAEAISETTEIEEDAVVNVDDVSENEVTEEPSEDMSDNATEEVESVDNIETDIIADVIPTEVIPEIAETEVETSVDVSEVIEESAKNNETDILADELDTPANNEESLPIEDIPEEMVVCPHCLFENPASVKICRACGKDVSEDPAPYMAVNYPQINTPTEELDNQPDNKTNNPPYGEDIILTNPHPGDERKKYDGGDKKSGSKTILAIFLSLLLVVVAIGGYFLNDKIDLIGKIKTAFSGSTTGGNDVAGGDVAGDDVTGGNETASSSIKEWIGDDNLPCIYISLATVQDNILVSFEEYSKAVEFECDEFGKITRIHSSTLFSTTLSKEEMDLLVSTYDGENNSSLFVRPVNPNLTYEIIIDVESINSLDSQTKELVLKDISRLYNDGGELTNPIVQIITTCSTINDVVEYVSIFGDSFYPESFGTYAVKLGATDEQTVLYQIRCHNKALGTIKLKADAIRIRTSPSSDATTFYKITKGITEELPFIDKTVSGGYTWYEIFDGGWVADENGKWLEAKLY